MIDILKKLTSVGMAAMLTLTGIMAGAHPSTADAKNSTIVESQKLTEREQRSQTLIKKKGSTRQEAKKKLSKEERLKIFAAVALCSVPAMIGGYAIYQHLSMPPKSEDILDVQRKFANKWNRNDLDKLLTVLAILDSSLINNKFVPLEPCLTQINLLQLNSEEKIKNEIDLLNPTQLQQLGYLLRMEMFLWKGNEASLISQNKIMLANQLPPKRLEEFNLIAKDIKQLSNRTLNGWNEEIHDTIIVPRIEKLRRETLEKRGLTAGEYIGSGQSGVILLCADKANQKVAVKIIAKNVNNLSEMAIRNEKYVLNEIENIKNGNIVKYKSSFDENGEVYFVMDYVEDGKNLSAIEPKDREQVIEWGQQILCGLRQLHDKEIAHRDIKSENVLLSKNGTIMICDYGLAKNSNLTRTFCGSRGMIPPEVLKYADISPESGTAYDGKKFDVYSTAITVFRILFAKTADEIICFTNNIYLGEPFPLSEDSRDRFGNCIGSNLYEFFKRCLSADPKNRPTAKEALNLLSA